MHSFPRFIFHLNFINQSINQSICSVIPPWLNTFTPAEVLTLEEESWNAYPKSKTGSCGSFIILEDIYHFDLSHRTCTKFFFCFLPSWIWTSCNPVIKVINRIDLSIYVEQKYPYPYIYVYIMIWNFIELLVSSARTSSSAAWRLKPWTRLTMAVLRM